eukprot:6422728-Amphidinium_carterae.1
MQPGTGCTGSRCSVAIARERNLPITGQPKLSHNLVWQQHLMAYDKTDNRDNDDNSSKSNKINNSNNANKKEQ